MTAKLSPVDRNAMQRAIAMTADEDAGRRRQINQMRRTDPFEEIGTFAVQHCQSRNLGLKPWENLPLWIDDLAAALCEPFDDQTGTREAAELFKKMLAAGLSKYEPDPLAAIGEAERKAAP